MLNLEQILKEIRKEGVVRRDQFPDYSFKQIRDLLEKNGIDRHTTLELESVEIAIRTPFGILMQIRLSDEDQLGLWGGVMENGELPEEAAVREIREETGISISSKQLRFVETNTHLHTYANGDKAQFTAYRFIVDFDHVPKITTDEEAVGAIMVTRTILAHEQEFVKRCLKDLPKG